MSQTGFIPEGVAPKVFSLYNGRKERLKAKAALLPSSTKTPSITERAESLLRSAGNLEKAGKSTAAMNVYRQIAKDFPGTEQARSAAERIKVMSGPSRPK
jgi:TolA-binding protein